MTQWIIKASSNNWGSKWLLGYPTTDRMSLIPTLEEIRERLPLYKFEIIEYTETTLDEIYPDRHAQLERSIKDFEKITKYWNLEN